MDRHLGHAQPVIAVDHHHLAESDDAAIEKKFHGFLDLLVELNNAAGAQIKDVFQQHAPTAEAQADCQLDVAEHFEPVPGVGG
jgi:hypothetical protein